MNEESSFEKYQSEDFSLNEYMMYFVGLGEGEPRSAGVGELVEKFPRSSEDVIDHLERLEEDGYIGSSETDTYVTQVKGFNEILEDTQLESVTDEELNGGKRFWLEEKGLEYVESRELEELRPSLKYTFELG